MRPGEPPGADGTDGRPDDFDAAVIDMGVEPIPQQRPVPWRVIGLIAALLLGGVIGYFVGDNHGRRPAPPAAAPSPTTVVKPFAAVALTGRQCSVQLGKRLQLGVEITNNTDHQIMLTDIQVGLPIGGLHVRSQGIRDVRIGRWQHRTAAAGRRQQHLVERDVRCRRAVPGSDPGPFRRGVRHRRVHARRVPGSRPGAVHRVQLVRRLAPHPDGGVARQPVAAPADRWPARSDRAPEVGPRHRTGSRRTRIRRWRRGRRRGRHPGRPARRRGRRRVWARRDGCAAPRGRARAWTPGRPVGR